MPHLSPLAWVIAPALFLILLVFSSIFLSMILFPSYPALSNTKTLNKNTWTW